MQRRVQSRVSQEQAGQTVLTFLATRFSYHTADEWFERIRAGRIQVNGTSAAADYRLGRGDVLDYVVHDIAEPTVNPVFSLIHDDADIMVIDKPPNLPCHPGGRYFNHTLWAEVKRRYGLNAPAFVNRLDRETSGLVVVARHERAARYCAGQFARRGVVKRYVVVVEGSFPETLDARGTMIRDAVSGIHKRWRFQPFDRQPSELDTAPSNGLQAVTLFRRLECHRGLSAVEATPHTGRHHQIRATLCSLGFAVVGDKLYGPDPLMFARFCTDALTEEDWSRLRLKRQALHAASLELRHPADGRVCRFEAPIPADMRALMVD